jgi:hypothetical protein
MTDDIAALKRELQRSRDEAEYYRAVTNYLLSQIPDEKLEGRGAAPTGGAGGTARP